MCVCVCVSSPAQCPEPGQVVRVVNTVADRDDFLEALDLNTEDLHRGTVCHQGHKAAGASGLPPSDSSAVCY